MLSTPHKKDFGQHVLFPCTIRSNGKTQISECSLTHLDRALSVKGAKGIFKNGSNTLCYLYSGHPEDGVMVLGSQKMLLKRGVAVKCHFGVLKEEYTHT